MMLSPKKGKQCLHFIDLETNEQFSNLPKATQLVNGTDFSIESS